MCGSRSVKAANAAISKNGVSFMGRPVKYSFFALRYYLVATSQQDLFETASRELQDMARQNLFIEKFLTHQVFVPKHGNPIVITGISENGSLYTGKIAKYQAAKGQVLVGEDIEDVDTKNWPYSEFICDTKPTSQLLVVKRNSQIGFTAEKLEKLLTELVSPLFNGSGYEITFHAINEVGSFWEAYQKADKVYQLELNLSMPNILAVNNNARKSLGVFRDLFNTTSVKTVITNETGDLKLPKPDIDSFVRYADAGSGSWKLKVLQDGEVKSIISASKAMVLSAFYEEGLDEKGLEGMLADFKRRLRENEEIRSYSS